MRTKTVLIAIVAVATSVACSTRPVANNANAPNTEVAPVPSRTADAPLASPSPSPTNAPADEAGSDNADFTGTAGVTEKKNLNIKGVAIMSDVRSARHSNYDRIVFEFAGPDLPTYHIEYIDKPVRACGSGDVVPLAGDGWLEVRFSDANAHTPEGQPTIKDRQRSPNLPIVRDLRLTCDFEAEVTWVAGVASPNRYRVIELKDPTRLAIDIKH